MLLNDDAFNEVASHVDDFEEGRSSHWTHEQKTFRFDKDSFSDVGPMGTFSQSQGLVPTVAHFFFQLPFRLIGLRYKHFLSIDGIARRIAKAQNRQYDLDLLRHVLTLAFLRKHLNLETETDPICIIGDGYANMASVILGALPKSRVILVNLNKSLIVDLVCLRKAFSEINCALARTPEELDEALSSENVRVVAIGANDAGILTGNNLSLAINIESMMEMDPPIIQEYFDLLRSCPGGKTAFYCCNQEFKQFSGEGTSNFHEYPWSKEDEILHHGLCHWTIFRYGNTPPFYSRRVPDLHRLVYLNNSGR